MSDRTKVEKRRNQTREHVEAMRGHEHARNIACSFCSKREGEAQAMFAGPSAVYICDECVTTFAQQVVKRWAGR
jgi:hypothetical protein